VESRHGRLGELRGGRSHLGLSSRGGCGPANQRNRTRQDPCAQRPEQIAARQSQATFQLFKSRVTWLCDGGDLPFGSGSLPLPGSTHDQTTGNRVKLNGMRLMGPRSDKMQPQTGFQSMLRLIGQVPPRQQAMMCLAGQAIAPSRAEAHS